jgi:hypothetical protein
MHPYLFPLTQRNPKSILHNVPQQAPAGLVHYPGWVCILHELILPCNLKDSYPTSRQRFLLRKCTAPRSLWTQPKLDQLNQQETHKPTTQTPRLLHMPPLSHPIHSSPSKKLSLSHRNPLPYEPHILTKSRKLQHHDVTPHPSQLPSHTRQLISSPCSTQTLASPRNLHPHRFQNSDLIIGVSKVCAESRFAPLPLSKESRCF